VILIRGFEMFIPKIIMQIKFLFVFILFAVNVFCNDKIAKTIHFNTENEMLMHNSVESVVRDSFGYIWVGTNYGLNRLDGYRTINYINAPGDTNSISNNFIKVLFVDSKGNLWIGTIGGGLNKYNYINNSFTKYIPSISENSILGLNVSAITEDHEGNLWMGIIGKGVSKFYPETSTFKHFDIGLFNPVFQHNSNISNLHCDANGNIWVGFDFDQNGIYKIDTKTGQNYLLAVPSGADYIIDQIALSGDEKYLYFTDKEKELHKIQLK